MSVLDELREVLAGSELDGVRFARSRRGFWAELVGGRRQEIRVTVRREDVVLSSIAAPSTVVPEDRHRRARFLRWLWELNGKTDLVAFGLDGYRRVVGTCRHPVATLDREELEVYALALVRECDRLERVLTGKDRY